jgi:peptidoglycan/LPS O-acetylase OafA/YrhL
MPQLAREEGVHLRERVIPEYSVHLDAARGAAALLVFVSHLRLFFIQSLGDPRWGAAQADLSAKASQVATATQDKVGIAHEAVMVFFVLSGFLVGGSVVKLLKQGRFTWKRYLIHRMVRLWIVFIPALLLGLLLDTTGLHHLSGYGTIYDVGRSLGLWSPDLQERLRFSTFAGNVFFLQGIKVPPFGTNQPLWSLANEFWYYIAFPFAALSFLGSPTFWKRLTSVAAVIAVLVFVGDRVAIYFVIWLLGVLAALLPLRIPLNLQRAFAGVALVLFLTVNVVARLLGAGGFLADLSVAVAFFILLYGLLHLRRPSKISYSLYVTHGPVLCMMSALLVGTYRRSPLNGHTILLLCEVVFAVAVVVCTIHYLFEAQTDRVRHYLEQKL